MPSFAPQHRTFRAAVSLATATTLLGASAFALSGPASAQEGQQEAAVRAIGATKLDSSSVTHHLSVRCVVPGQNSSVDCVPAGSVKITVDAATKKKLKLKSATIGTAEIVAMPATSEDTAGGRARVKASKAVRKQLAKVNKVKVTYTLTVTAPVTAVLKTTGTWSVDTFDGAKRLLLRSPGDTFAISGRG
jgi:hypothetical protein